MATSVAAKRFATPIYARTSVASACLHWSFRQRTMSPRRPPTAAFWPIASTVRATSNWMRHMCRISKRRIGSPPRCSNSLRSDPPMDERERHEKGMEVRRAVLGDAHVDRAEARRSTFNGEFQDLITRHAWGEIWTRPGLPRHTRSLLTIGLMVALNRSDEFKLHIRAAFNNGVTKDEIKEVLLQCAIYAGVPAANSAFHQAEEVFAQMESAPK